MSKKAIELPKCGCGGKPSRVKDRKGRHLVACPVCGKKTRWHSRPTDATKEWMKMRIFGKYAFIPPPPPLSAATPPHMRATGMIEAGQRKNARMDVLRKVGLVSSLAWRLEDAVAALGGIVCGALGASIEEVREAVREGVGKGFSEDKSGGTIEITANVISGDKAKRLVAALAEAGVPIDVQALSDEKSKESGRTR